MPWDTSDAVMKTQKATTAPLKRAWAVTANSVLDKTGDEGKAVRIANAVVKRIKYRSKGK